MRHIARLSIVALILIAGTAAAQEELWIPASASNPGLHGTTWTTDLWLLSHVLDVPIDVNAAFFPDQAGVNQPDEVDLELQPSSQIKISDAVATLFGENRPGAIRLRSAHPFSAQSRTANDGGSNGTFGQGIPAFSASEAADSLVFLSAANRPGNGGVRTNIGLVNLSPEEGRITIAARDAQTNVDLGTYTFDLGPNGWFQADLFALLGADGQTVNLADVSVLGGGTILLGYLSQVDNRSGDGTFIAPTVGEFIRIEPGTWELKAVLTFEDANMHWFEYDLPDGTVTRIDDPDSGSDTGTLYFTGPRTFCARASGEAGPGPNWGVMEIKIDRRPIGGTWYRGRHHYRTEPNGPMNQEYCVELD